MNAEDIRSVQINYLQELKQQYSIDRECGVCYKKFITLTLDDYQAIIDEIRIQYGTYVAIRFEIEMPIEQSFIHRFVCLTCKNNDICFGCLAEITKRKIIIYPDSEKVIIAKCPFCRIDKILIPIGVLDDIKRVI
jgi:hypothetical protein